MCLIEKKKAKCMALTESCDVKGSAQTLIFHPGSENKISEECALLPEADRHLKGISGTSGAAVLMKD